jgi:flagellar biosynthesis protein FlhB
LAGDTPGRVFKSEVLIMSKDETAKKLAEDANKQRLESQNQKMERLRLNDSKRVEDLTSEMMRLATAMATMTDETQGAMREMKATAKTLTKEAESAMSQARQAARELQESTRQMTLKLWLWMMTAAIVVALVVAIAYSKWLQASNSVKAQFVDSAQSAMQPEKTPGRTRRR